MVPYVSFALGLVRRLRVDVLLCLSAACLVAVFVSCAASHRFNAGPLIFRRRLLKGNGAPGRRAQCVR